MQRGLGGGIQASASGSMAQRSNFRALLTDRQKPFTHTLTFNRQGKRPDNAHKPVQAQEMAGNGIPDGRKCGIWKELIVIVKYTYVLPVKYTLLGVYAVRVNTRALQPCNAPVKTTIEGTALFGGTQATHSLSVRPSRPPTTH